MLGKTQHDQDWIDSNIEGGVGGCNWQRPKPRPSSWDNASAPRPLVAAKKQRVGIIKRIKARVIGVQSPDPPQAVEPVAATPLPLPPPPPPVVIAPKRSDLDELLDPVSMK